MLSHWICYAAPATPNTSYERPTSLGTHSPTPLLPRSYFLQVLNLPRSFFTRHGPVAFHDPVALASPHPRYSRSGWVLDDHLRTSCCAETSPSGIWYSSVRGYNMMPLEFLVMETWAREGYHPTHGLPQTYSPSQQRAPALRAFRSSIPTPPSLLAYSSGTNIMQAGAAL